MKNMRRVLALLTIELLCFANTLPARQILSGVLQAQGGIALVNTAWGLTTATGTTVVTASFSVTSGNCLVILGRSGNYTSGTITGVTHLGNTVTPLNSYVRETGAGIVQFLSAPVTTGGTDYITLTVPSGTYNSAIVYQFSGLACTQDGNAVATALGSTTGWTSGNYSTTQANEVIVYATTIGSLSVNLSPGPMNGNTPPSMMCVGNTASTGTTSGTCTGSVAGGEYSIVSSTWSNKTAKINGSASAAAAVAVTSFY